MEQVLEPKVFLIAETKLLPELNNFLAHIKAPTWESDATSDAERLIEVMGRLCYRSFGDSLNPNLTKVRVGNYPYLENIISSGHGSVLEHATVSFIFADVSRVFTHELVRHRAGVAISQESLRFVRLDRIKQWLPTVITEDLNAMSIAVDTIEKCEEAQQALAKLWNLGEMPFSEKKKIHKRNASTGSLWGSHHDRVDGELASTPPRSRGTYFAACGGGDKASVCPSWKKM